MIRSIVVDDDRDFRTLVRIWMEKVGPAKYEVVGEAASGLECLDLVEQLRPDLVLLDLTMPQTDPYELIEDIGARFPGTSVIVLSGFDADRVEAEVIASGARGYLEKCTSIGLLRERLDRLVAECA
ncbi:MAG: response regulator transcription factor [Acidimicrobiia bacterium]|nr:response regulator transcription factor [Acidimicrobiia bacterium]MDH4306730.1 response regulator transcription factor [Acidimicrobiia bacterium]MDH5293171.1 response regulator transcription factor [Acidimicrobiia bacterium]